VETTTVNSNVTVATKATLQMEVYLIKSPDAGISFGLQED
jgi:hypothetical protein